MTQTLTKKLAAVGEEITPELGLKMIKDYHQAYQNDVAYFEIGRNILDRILAQPGCVAVRYYNALNELGQKTLVYTGLNKDNEVIAEYVTINTMGQIEKAKGIIADRLKPPPGIIEVGTDSDTAWGLPE